MTSTTKQPSFTEAVGISKLSEQKWMKRARCVYGNATEIMGHSVIGEDGKAIMSPEEFYELIDKTFNSDWRWTSGREAKGLRQAVQECLKCPVREECLKYAMEETFRGATSKAIGIPTGILGATTAWERKTLADPKFMPHLDTEQRLAFLRALVSAKERGWVNESVRIDMLYTNMKKMVAIPLQVECCKGCCDDKQDREPGTSTGPAKSTSRPVLPEDERQEDEGQSGARRNDCRSDGSDCCQDNER